MDPEVTLLVHFNLDGVAGFGPGIFSEISWKKMGNFTVYLFRICEIKNSNWGKIIDIILEILRKLKENSEKFLTGRRGPSHCNETCFSVLRTGSVGL